MSNINGLSGDHSSDHSGGPGWSVVPQASSTAVPMADPIDATARFQSLVPDPTTIGFPEEWWDPTLRAQLYLADFAATTWISTTDPLPPTKPRALEEIQKLLYDRRDLRSLRQAEIIAQANDFVSYFHQILGIAPGRKPNTATLIEVAVAVGHMVGMYWKNRYAQARPTQYYPALMTVVPTPSHPSYPSNHALQSQLVALCVLEAMPLSIRPAWDDPLNKLALRIAENREVAGVHFPEDSKAGRKTADSVFKLLLTMKSLDDPTQESFRILLNEAQKEWSGWSKAAAPPKLIPATATASAPVAAGIATTGGRPAARAGKKK